jgi:hypothetical protein
MFAEPRPSDIQKISGPLFAEKIASLIITDWPSLKMRRSL